MGATPPITTNNPQNTRSTKPDQASFAAYPSAFVPSDPHRDPGPGRVDHLHHHAPVALCDHPTTRAASTAVSGLYVEHQSI